MVGEPVGGVVVPPEPLPAPRVLRVPVPPVLPEPLPVLPEPVPVLPDPDVLPEPLVLPVPDVVGVPEVEAVVPLLLLPPHPARQSAAVTSDTRALDCCVF